MNLKTKTFPNYKEQTFVTGSYANLIDAMVCHRNQLGISQEELAELAKVNLRTIQRIEKGEVQPHLQTVKLLAAGLGIEVDDLIVLDNPKEEMNFLT